MSRKGAKESTSGDNMAAASAPVAWWRAMLREPVALGLILPIFIRPWLDGVTYPTDNFYFVWALVVLFVLWGVQVLMRGLPIHGLLPTGLLAGFWIVAALTALSTTQVDTTYRALILWAGYFFLFVLTINAVRTPAALGIVLTAFVVTSLIETMWSLVHFKYMLPMVRESVNREPMLLKTYFGTMIPTAELIHRLNVNRAFGSLLFPNALAAFLILGIPYALGESARSISSLTELLRAWRVDPKSFRRPTPFWALLVTLLAWLVATCVVYFFFTTIATFRFPTEEGVHRLGPLRVLSDGQYEFAGPRYLFRWFSWVGVLPVLVATAVGYVLRRYGVRILTVALRVWVLPPLVILQAAALWLTYSRGGLLALVAAIAFTVAILVYRSKKASVVLAAAAVLIMVLSSTVAGPAGATPPTPPESAPGVEQAAPVPGQAPVSPNTPGTPDPGVPSADNAVPAGTPSGPDSAITKEGVDLTMSDLMNPASFGLRLTYWRTGLRMALANFWSGVGLGNFGTVYPKFQYVGAGDVKTAHNDYLQALCETGLLGFLFFCAFWLYFVLWGLLRLWRENDRRTRWVLAGLYTSVLAFLVHSLVDFNFFNPSLAFFAFMLAAVFYSWAGNHRGENASAPIPSKNRLHQLLVLPMVIIAALVGGMAFRVYMSDYILGGYQMLNVGNRMKMNAAFDAGEFLFSPVPNGSAEDKGKYPVKDIVTMMTLVPDPAVLRTFGSIRVAAEMSNGRLGHRALRPDEVIPRSAFFVLMDSAKAREEARKRIEQYLAELGWADSIFPHNPELAAYFAQWYDLLAAHTADDETRNQYAVQFLHWAKEAVRRSPECFVFREWLAKALWSRGNTDTSDSRTQYFEQGLEEYRMAAELCPSSPRGWRQYGDALLKYGNALITIGTNGVKAGKTVQGQAFIDQGKELLPKGQEMLERAKQIEQQTRVS